MNSLEQLKRVTTVVADTGNFKQLAQYAPRDATTNPSLILKAVQQSDYAPLVEEVVRTYATQNLDEQIDHLLVRFGVEILRTIPGRVSTEVDARLSFDTAATIERGRRLMALYAQQGLGRERILIKIAATWEGIEAAKQLEADGIHCNLTLVFAFCQAVGCAQAGVQLISPFVGRVYDWHKKAASATWVEAERAGVNDPGCSLVTQIYNYYKKFDIPTEVMGASFRNVNQIHALAGCDLLTISPELLSALQQSNVSVPAVLSVNMAQSLPLSRVEFNEAEFRYALNEDAMATEKLAEGIRAFALDAQRLDQIVGKLNTKR